MSVWLDIFCLSPVGLCGHQEWVQADVLPVVCGLFLLNSRLCGGALSSSALTKLLAEAVGASETLLEVSGEPPGEGRPTMRLTAPREAHWIHWRPFLVTCAPCGSVCGHTVMCSVCRDMGSTCGPVQRRESGLLMPPSLERATLHSASPLPTWLRPELLTRPVSAGLLCCPIKVTWKLL